jgi:hypothetical protein
MDLEKVRQRLIEYYAKLAVPTDQLLSYLAIENIQEMDKEKCFELKALATAIKEGTTSVKESFAAHTEAARKEAAKSKEEKVTDKKKDLKEKKAETKEAGDSKTTSPVLL